MLVLTVGSPGAAPAGAPPAPSHFVGSDAPAWSPDGRRIAFVGFRGGRFGDIYTIAPSGGRQVRLTRTAAHDDHPAWSPDGRKLAFASSRDGAFQIVVMDADGSRQTVLTRTEASNYAPAWSPDGTRIAFRSDRDGNGEIYVMDADGANPRRLTASPESDSWPTWSPDGRTIAFTSFRNRIAHQIYLVAVDGSGERRLVPEAPSYRDELRPDWSPDGTRIAFVSDLDLPLGNQDVYVVDVDAGAPRRISRSPLREDWPSWSPDGARIAFSRGFDVFRQEVFVMRADGGAARKLTGTTLRLLGVTRAPVQPRAGRRFVVELAVRPALDRFAELACAAVVSRRLLVLRLGDVVRGRVRCVWLIPRSAQGKRIRGVVLARAGGSEVLRTFSLAVR